MALSTARLEIRATLRGQYIHQWFCTGENLGQNHVESPTDSAFLDRGVVILAKTMTSPHVSSDLEMQNKEKGAHLVFQHIW